MSKHEEDGALSALQELLQRIAADHPNVKIVDMTCGGPGAGRKAQHHPLQEVFNRCIDQARQQRLETIQRARALESEAHQLKLEQRQRAAAEAQAAQRDSTAGGDAGAATDTSADEVHTPPAATVTPLPLPDGRITPDAAAERIRAERARSAAEAEAGAQAARAARDAEKADKRARTEAEAAARAAAADQDRARYEERLRKYEEEQAAKKK